MVAESARSSGQVTACASTLEIYRRFAQILREALARDHQTPQVLRIGRLVGRLRAMEDPDLGAEFREMLSAIAAFNVTPGSPPEARARRWSERSIVGFSTTANFDTTLEQLLAALSAGKPTNRELKVLVRAKAEATLSPTLITDRDVLMTFDDSSASDRWGIWFRGPQHRAFFERWFDDLWASILESYLLYSRNGFNENAISRIRKEFEEIEAAQTRQSA
jgi:hypothetical protein